MHGSTATKIARVSWHLLRTPAYFWRYVSTAPVTGVSPVELGLPWISFSAIDFLCDWVNRKHRVFEWGCGGSTIFFGSRAGSVVSLEDDREWYSRVKDVLAERQIVNVDLRLAPFNVGNAAAFGESGYLSAVREDSWDLILIDGVLGFGSGGDHGTHRQACFDVAQNHVKAGGVVVVDDSWMFPEMRNSSRAKSWKEFVSVGPCRLGVTSTAVFFY